MLRSLIARTLSTLLTLWALLTLTFFCLRLAPGGPFDAERSTLPEIQAQIEAQYGLSDPLIIQYTRWLSGAVRFDFHESFQYLGRPVSEIIQGGLGTSALLGLFALGLSLSVGIPLGTLGARFQGRFLDGLALGLSVLGSSLPSFVVASLLVWLFALKLELLPAALLEEPSAWILPVVTLALRPLAMITRLTRSSLLEVLSQDYIRTARSKGLSESRVVGVHALRNALIPVLTLLGPLAAQLLTGSFVVEIVFQIPGLGKHFVSAVLNRDYPLVMGLTVVFGSALLLANWLVDLFYGLVDPRLRESEEAPR